MRKPLIFSTFAVSTALALPSTSLAATAEEIAAELLKATTAALGIEVTDPALAEELVEGLEYALEEGVISEDVSETIEESLDSGSETDGLEEQLDANIIDQIANWEEYAPEYRVAFELVRAEFQACRQSAGSASSCARGIGFNMQVAMANDALTRLQLLEQQLTDSGIILTDEERAVLEAERAELIAKIQRAEEKLARLAGDSPVIKKAKEDMARIRNEAAKIGIDLDSAVTVPGQSGNAGGSNGNSGGNQGGGNAGGNGNGGGSNSGGNGHSGGNGNGKGRP